MKLMTRYTYQLKFFFRLGSSLECYNCDSCTFSVTLKLRLRKMAQLSTPLFTTTEARQGVLNVCRAS